MNEYTDLYELGVAAAADLPLDCFEFLQALQGLPIARRED